MKEGQQLHRCFLKRNHLGDVLGKCHHQALQVPASEAEPQPSLEGLTPQSTALTSGFNCFLNLDLSISELRERKLLVFADIDMKGREERKWIVCSNQQMP